MMNLYDIQPKPARYVPRRTNNWFVREFIGDWGIWDKQERRFCSLFFYTRKKDAQIECDIRNEKEKIT